MTKHWNSHSAASWKLFVAAFTLCTGLAGQQAPASRIQIAGNVPGASGSSPAAWFAAYPTYDNSGQFVYSVWWGVSYGSFGSSNYGNMTAHGTAPASVVSRTSPDSISVSVDLAQVQDLIWDQWGCNYHFCGHTSTPPASFPMKVTVAAIQSPGYVTEYLGAYQLQEFEFQTTLTTRSDGNFTDRSAAFSGTIGPVTVAPPPNALNNGHLFFNRGNTVVEITTTN